MRLLRRHQSDQGQIGEAGSLDTLRRSSASLTEDGIGALVVGDLPKGFRPGEPVRRQEVIPFLRHAPDCAPQDCTSVTGKRRRRTAKDCGKSAKQHSERLSALLIAFWRRQHPKKTAEQIAAKHGVSVRVAYEWLQGKLPPVWHFAGMIATGGPAFVKAVLHKLAEHDDGTPRLRFRRRQTEGAA